MRSYIEKPPKISMLMARDYARRMTFQDRLTKVGKAISNIRRSAPWLTPALPFVRVIWNITRLGTRMVPGSHLLTFRYRNGTVEPYGWRRLAGKRGPRDQAQAIVEQIMGGMILLATYGLVSSGRMTAGGPDDPEQRRVWSQVFRPYSFLIGGEWWNYTNNGLDFLTWPLGLMANFWESTGIGSVEGLDPDQTTTEEAAQFMNRVVAGTSHFILQHSMLRTPREIYQWATEPEKRETFLARQVSPVIPNFAQWLSRTTQDTVPEVDSSFHELKSKIPWASRSMLPRRDLFGDPIMRDAWKTPEYARDPVKSRKRRWATELVRLGFGRARPPKTILGGVELTPQEYDAWAQAKGSWFFHGVNAAMSSPTYWTQGDQFRKRIVRETTSAFSFSEEAFMAVMLNSDNPRVLNKWLEIERNLGKSSTAGGVF